MARLLGESDVVPVIANLPRETFRNRMVKSRQIKNDGDDSVRRMVGEASEDSAEEQDSRDEEVIPKDAEPVDPTEMTVGKPLREPKEIVQEPSHPTGDKEKYQTPYAALTAPDVTPQATQPIDPSRVPGAAGPERFRASDLERAEPSEPAGGEDMAVRAMDVLLGRNRASKPASQPGEFEAAGAVATEEQAAAMMGVSSIMEDAQAKAANLLVAAKDGGGEMPPPAPAGDGHAIYSAFRRFAG
jgi:hypothetical protein